MHNTDDGNLPSSVPVSYIEIAKYDTRYYVARIVRLKARTYRTVRTEYNKYSTPYIYWLTKNTTVDKMQVKGAGIEPDIKIIQSKKYKNATLSLEAGSQW
jgi:hypothetical protein